MNNKKLLLLIIFIVLVLILSNIFFFNKNVKYESYISNTIRINLTGVGNTLENIENELEMVINSDKELTEKNINYLAHNFLNIQINLKELEEIRLKLDIAMEKQHPGSVDTITLFSDLNYIILYEQDKLDDEKFLLAVSELISEFYGLFDDVPLKTSNDPYKYYENYWNNMLKKDDWLILIGKMNELAHKNQEIVR